MRVLHIITGLANGGAEGALYRLVTADHGNRHEIISMIDSGVYGQRLAAVGIPLHTLSMPRGRVTLRGSLEIYRLVRAIKPDVVQTWMYHADLVGGVIAKLAGQRAITWGIRAADAHDYAGFSSRLLVWLCARLSKVVPTRIIFVSNAGSRVHQQVGYSAPKSRVIANGFNTTDLRPDTQARSRQREEWNMPPDIILIGMVARWDSLKDHETLIAALRTLTTCAVDSWLCMLVGPGTTGSNEDLAAMLHRYGLSEKVRCIGPVSDMRSVMNALDLHVLSSKSEGFPNVLAEAMSCATPCVATNVGDAAAIVGGTGWLVPPMDPVGLAAALEQALFEMRDSVEWHKRKVSARRRVLDNLGIDQMVASYNEVWNDAVNAHEQH